MFRRMTSNGLWYGCCNDVTKSLKQWCYEVEATKWCQIKCLPSQSYVWHHAESLDFTGFLETMVAMIFEMLANVTKFWLWFDTDDETVS